MGSLAPLCLGCRPCPVPLSLLGGASTLHKLHHAHRRAPRRRRECGLPGPASPPICRKTVLFVGTVFPQLPWKCVTLTSGVLESHPLLERVGLCQVGSRVCPTCVKAGSAGAPGSCGFLEESTQEVGGSSGLWGGAVELQFREPPGHQGPPSQLLSQSKSPTGLGQGGAHAQVGR